MHSGMRRALSEVHTQGPQGSRDVACCCCQDGLSARQRKGCNNQEAGELEWTRRLVKAQARMAGGRRAAGVG